LACGTPVVASSAIGSAEHVDRAVCRIFEDGNMDAFEERVRQLIVDLNDENTASDIFLRSRLECERLYSGAAVAENLLEELRQLAGKSIKQKVSSLATSPRNTFDDAEAL